MVRIYFVCSDQYSVSTVVTNIKEAETATSLTFEVTLAGIL
jgi:cellobiose-specific phosphotransferase system component IIB